METQVYSDMQTNSVILNQNTSQNHSQKSKFLYPNKTIHNNAMTSTKHMTFYIKNVIRNQKISENITQCLC